MITRESVAALADAPPSPAEIAAALAALDGERAVAGLLARAVAAVEVDAGQVAKALPLVPDIDLLAPLAHAAGDAAATALLHAARSRQLPPTEHAEVLVLCALVAGAADRTALVREIRLAAHLPLTGEPAWILGVAARIVGDDDAIAITGAAGHVAEEVDPYVDRLRHRLSAPILDVLDSADAPRAVSGFTVRRAVDRVGRNDPCPCGSGRKYKRCCLGTDRDKLADPSPIAGVTMQEYRRRVHELLDDDAFAQLHPRDLGAVDLDELTPRQLSLAVQSFADYAYFDWAERALHRLEGTDYYRKAAEDVLYFALVAGAREPAERAAAALADVPDDLALGLALVRGDADALERLEALIRRDLDAAPAPALADVAATVARTHPALGVLLARGALATLPGDTAERLLYDVEEARDRLDLPPGDIAGDLLDILLDEVARRAQRAAVDERLAGELDDTRFRLRETAARASELERELRAAREELERAKAAATRDHAAADADADEVRRLRQKIEELKGHVTASQQERRALREQVAEMSRAVDGANARTAGAEREDEGAEPGVAADLPDSSRPLVPVFTPAARRSLDALPARAAADAIRVAARIAAGDRLPGFHVKKLERIDDVWSARAGIHYRLLFRMGDGVLELLDVVPREDLLTAIRRMHRS